MESPLTAEIIEQVRARFLAKVQKKDGCWLWTASTIGGGYGGFWLAGRMRLAHRVAYELWVGAIPEGTDLDHFRCETPGCVNPDHLRPASPRENTLRGKGPAAVNAAKTHCKRGHPLSGDNLYVRTNGNRTCRECHRTYMRERYRRRTDGARA